MQSIGRRSKDLGHFTKDDFLAFCRWKSERNGRLYNLNSPEEIHRQTAIALASADEETRISSLTELKGVSYPTASVFLHFAYGELYPILDYRALWSLQCDRKSYTFAFWYDYVQACRLLATECQVPMRVLDRALWEYSNANQLRDSDGADRPVTQQLLTVCLPR